MIILACETSTLLGSVAVLENDRVLAYEESMRQGSHSDALNLFIERTLAASGKSLKDVGLFATGTGPGSFTGIRISLNTVKTLAYCYAKPVLGISSLQSLAQNSFELEPQLEMPITAMINAYKNMVYIATYRKLDQGLVEVKKPEVIRVQNLQDYFGEDSIVCGDGYATYEKFFPAEMKSKMKRPIGISDEPNARILGQLAFHNRQKSLSWNQIVPLYIRASEAEENLQGIKYQPLF